LARPHRPSFACRVRADVVAGGVAEDVTRGILGGGDSPAHHDPSSASWCTHRHWAGS
jgi:hypothetical protein